jgi:hypothetical protein
MRAQTAASGLSSSRQVSSSLIFTPPIGMNYDAVWERGANIYLNSASSLLLSDSGLSLDADSKRNENSGGSEKNESLSCKSGSGTIEHNSNYMGMDIMQSHILRKAVIGNEETLASTSFVQSNEASTQVVNQNNYCEEYEDDFEDEIDVLEPLSTMRNTLSRKGSRRTKQLFPTFVRSDEVNNNSILNHDNEVLGDTLGGSTYASLFDQYR